MLHKACAYLIKQALADPMQFVMDKPFTDRTPNEFTPDDERELVKLKNGMPPGREKIVDAGLNAKERVRSWAQATKI